MSHGLLGWLEFGDESEANLFVSQIDSCMGFPTPDGKTETWAYPACLANGYYPTATTENWYVIVKDEIEGCMTPEQISQIILELPLDWYECGTPVPSPSGSTMNY